MATGTAPETTGFLRLAWCAVSALCFSLLIAFGPFSTRTPSGLPLACVGSLGANLTGCVCPSSPECATGPPPAPATAACPGPECNCPCLPPGSSELPAPPAEALGGRAPAGSDPTDDEVAAFIDGFQAADPYYTARCKKALVGEGVRPYSDFAQFFEDVIVFRNVFLKATMAGRKGVYIESGANDWSKLSASLFFDKCLGWDGLCIEPQSRYHGGLRKHRSCKLIPECIAETTRNVSMGNGVMGGIIGSAAGTTRCRPLHEMIREAGWRHIDYWILDVEGYETEILNTLDWEQLSFTAILVEDNKRDLHRRNLDMIFAERGFAKFQLHIDSLYVARGKLNDILIKPWIHPGAKELQKSLQETKCHRPFPDC